VLSIEAAKKIAEAFKISLDYLAGEGINDQFYKRPSSVCGTLRT
jgi:hypothetical protein